MVVGNLHDEFHKIHPLDCINYPHKINMNFLEHNCLKIKIKEFLEFQDKSDYTK